MKQLKEQLNGINKVIPKGSKVYYFDYPVYSNVGDMLIWKGTEKFLKENNIKVVKRLSYHLVNYLLGNRKLKIPKDVIILCQGGGNFGDLYNVHQNLRKLLVENLPEHKIVILPQSIYYNDKHIMEKDFTLFSKHKNLHLYVRDQNSYKIATQYLKNVYLSQDMAHALYPVISKREFKYNTLYFFRKDKERTEVDFTQIEIDPAHIFDWDQLYSSSDNKIINIFKKAHNSYKIYKYFPVNFLSKLWYLYASYKINQAIKMCSKYEEIITSRLHGHILACLMDKKNIVLDNSYGKNSGYYNAWTNQVKDAKLFNDHKENMVKQM
ncbi:polysaccharide pyruvyl transferase family protein [Metabacillus litoralis]|uniref:polysaccharide pyruvyl transferase family protein n=1 Tax=Metabacillus litoralis TaxID=152268 RepID=UPI002040CB8C|nr:polysaccharide pyruvyl transferase family protein [Metabacillus litoralis]MCM3412439.1 polysaccharide pyruvyl transferase family protein [Metabacillus litoralis]